MQDVTAKLLALSPDVVVGFTNLAVAILRQSTTSVPVFVGAIATRTPDER
jgi:hypothetical protein